MSQTQSDSFLKKLQKRTIYYTKYTIFYVLSWIYYYLYEYGILLRPPPPVTITSLSDAYIEKHKKIFMDSYEITTEQDTSINIGKNNANIEKCFYDSKLHALEIEHPDNELEKTWKRRIMFENTPRGNIIMHYDAYKQGFVYYSDNSNIPYFVINAAIMKYVLLFRCRDFFIDDQITPADKKSPLLDIQTKTQSTENPPKLQTTTVSAGSVPKSSAFIKMKSYNTVSAKLAPKPSDKKEGDIPEISIKYTRNKIIYSGKISNFQLLQKPNKKPKSVVFSSNLVSDLEENADTQSKVFSYRDFKALRKDKIGEQ